MARLDPDSRAQVAAPQAPHRLGEALDGTGDALGEGPGRDADHEEHDGHREGRAPEGRRAEGTRRGSLDDPDQRARRRIPDGRGGKTSGMTTDDDASRAHRRLLRGRERGKLIAAGGDETTGGVPHAHVEVEVVVELAQARAEGGGITEPL